jgi:hypothetical protein
VWADPISVVDDDDPQRVGHKQFGSELNHPGLVDPVGVSHRVRGRLADGEGNAAGIHRAERAGVGLDRVARLANAFRSRREWRERKTAYLQHLDEVSDDAILRVVLADKVNNARSIVRDYRVEGQTPWEAVPETGPPMTSSGTWRPSEFDLRSKRDRPVARELEVVSGLG